MNLIQTKWFNKNPKIQKNEVSSPYKQVFKKTIYEIYKKENFEDKNPKIPKDVRTTYLIYFGTI